MSRAAHRAGGDQGVHDARVIEEAAGRILRLAEAVGVERNQIAGTEFAGADLGIDLREETEHRGTPVQTLDRAVAPDQHRMHVPGIQVVEPAARGFEPGQNRGHVAAVLGVLVEVVIQILRGAGDPGPAVPERNCATTPGRKP